jgi:hypothetical protein
VRTEYTYTQLTDCMHCIRRKACGEDIVVVACIAAPSVEGAHRIYIYTAYRVCNGGEEGFNRIQQEACG